MSLAGVKRAPARQSSGKLATAASPARLPAALLLSRRRSALFGRSNTCAARAATFIRAIERGAAQTPRPMRSYYDVLGVPTTATPQELRAAFTAAALRLHPDKAAQQPAADRSAAEFLEAQRAYQVLRDPHLRRIHDQELQLHSMRQCFNFQDELGVDEMRPAEQQGVVGFEYPCRCGGAYWLPRADIAGAVQSVVVPCFQCSCVVLVDVTGVHVDPPAGEDVGDDAQTASTPGAGP